MLDVVETSIHFHSHRGIQFNSCDVQIKVEVRLKKIFSLSISIVNNVNLKGSEFSVLILKDENKTGSVFPLISLISSLNSTTVLKTDLQ